MKEIKDWSNTARESLVGRDVVDARFLTDEECKEMGWSSSSLVISLGTKTIDGEIASPILLYASNDEGNDAGFVHVSGNNDLQYFPIINIEETDG